MIETTTDICETDIASIMNLGYVAVEAVEGRCRTAGSFGGDAEGVIWDESSGEAIALVDRDSMTVTMAAFGEGRGDADSDEWLDHYRMVIKGALANPHDDWSVRDAADEMEFERLREGG